MGSNSTPRLLITYSVLVDIFEETFITVMHNFAVMPPQPSFLLTYRLLLVMRISQPFWLCVCAGWRRGGARFRFVPMPACVKGVLKTKKAQSVASACAAGFRKVCLEVLKKKGAMARR